MIEGTTRRNMLLSSAGAAAAPLAAGQPAGNSAGFRGYWPILSTPFDMEDSIDEAAMEKQVEFCVRCGVEGVVWPQLISEFFVLSEEERRRTAELILRTSKRRLRVIIGVQTPSRKAAAKLAEHATEHGAAAVIALPPYEGQPALEMVGTYYKRIAASTNLPVFIQNTGGVWGPALPTSFVIQMAKDHPQFGHVKEEVTPSIPRYEEYSKSGVMKSIFSGTGGRFLPHDLAHGAHGSMNIAAFADITAQIWSLYSTGKRGEAFTLHERLLALQNLGDLHRGFAKAVLVKRGVFKSARSRNQAEPAPFPLPQDKEYADVCWRNLQPHFKA